MLESNSDEKAINDFGNDFEESRYEQMILHGYSDESGVADNDALVEDGEGWSMLTGYRTRLDCECS